MPARGRILAHSVEHPSAAAPRRNAPAPAHANGAAFYTAELATPATERTSIIGGVAWQCQGTACVAAKSNSRPVVVCQRVARELGEVTAFTAKGKALAEKDLARCNRK